MTTVREQSETVIHPDFYNGWTKVDQADHPAVKALYDGDAALLWEGDPRLCLYRNALENCYILIRLEADEQYRLVVRSPAGEIIGVDSINRLIRKLQAHDTRRGFDLLDATMGYNDRRRSQMDADFSEQIHEDITPRLVHAMSRSYLPGIDVLPRLR